ncbi:hypothetical protein GCM10017673_40210 [Streptosporangium violaceochromogenes]|nr:hypothetical protein GCM10017673_40210 [Streptosporangium violaceochromogenes]
MTGPDVAYAWLEEQADAYAALLADQPRTAPPVPPYLVHPGVQPRPTAEVLAAFAEELRDAQAVTP